MDSEVAFIQATYFLKKIAQKYLSQAVVIDETSALEFVVKIRKFCKI